MLNRNTLYICTLLCTFTTTQSITTQKVIVFDVTNTILCVKDKGPGSISEQIPGLFTSGLMYALSHLSFSIEKAEQEFQKLLQSFGQQAGPLELMVRDQNGAVVPQILVRWLSGNLTSPQLIAQIQKRATNTLFKKIAATVFNSTMMARFTVALPGAATCIERAITTVGAQYVFVIGNWERTAFHQATQQASLQPIFGKVPSTNRIISGDIHQLMPRNAREFFDIISTQTGVARENIIFISGMPHHVTAALNLGVVSFLVCKNDFEKTWNSIRSMLS